MWSQVYNPLQSILLSALVAAIPIIAPVIALAAVTGLDLLQLSKQIGHQPSETCWQF
jgi:hypothetical protein